MEESHSEIEKCTTDSEAINDKNNVTQKAVKDECVLVLLLSTIHNGSSKHNHLFQIYAKCMSEMLPIHAFNSYFIYTQLLYYYCHHGI